MQATACCLMHPKINQIFLLKILMFQSDGLKEYWGRLKI